MKFEFFGGSKKKEQEEQNLAREEAEIENDLRDSISEKLEGYEPASESDTEEEAEEEQGSKLELQDLGDGDAGKVWDKPAVNADPYGVDTLSPGDNKAFHKD